MFLALVEISMKEKRRYLSLDPSNFDVSLDRAFRWLNICNFSWNKGPESASVARQMECFVEQGNGARLRGFSESNRSACEDLTSKVEVQATNNLAKSRLRKSISSRRSGPSGTGEDYGDPGEHRVGPA